MLARTAYAWILAVVALLGFVVVAGSHMLGSPSAGRLSQAPTASQIATFPLSLKSSERITALDAAPASTGALHAAWIQGIVDRPGTLPRHELAYSRLDAGSSTWTPPRTILDGVVNVGDMQDAVRIVTTEDGAIHIFVDYSLRHFVSEDGGSSWREVASLLRDGQPTAVAFDAVTIGDHVAIVFLAKPASSYGVESRKTTSLLWFVEYVPSNPTMLREVGRLTEDESGPPTRLPPRLIRDGSDLHLLVPLNQWRTVTAETQNGLLPAGSGVKPRLFYLKSSDDGQSWTASREIFPLEDDSTRPEGPGRLTSIDLAVGEDGQLFAFFTGIGSYMVRSKDGTTWSAPITIAPYEITFNRGAGESSSIRAIATSRSLRLFWIDSRFRKRTSLNPLADQQYLANNDVFSLESPLGPNGDVIVPITNQPERLTTDLSYSHFLNIMNTADATAVLWSGRERVGKQLDSEGASESLFSILLPIDH